MATHPKKDKLYEKEDERYGPKGPIYFLFLTLICSSTYAGITDTIPTKFKQHKNDVLEETTTFSPGFDPGFVAAFIEGESCISLTHSKCWSSKSRLKTRREEGAGLGQLTRTYRKNGSIRFDTLTRLTKKYGTHLGELNWTNVYEQPKLQIRAMVLLLMENWNSLPDTIKTCNRLPFIASGYNQGMGGVKKDRRLCGLKKKCDPNKWFGNVATVKRVGFSTRILYGKRTAWDINRKHVSLILKKRLSKYRNQYQHLINTKGN